MSRRDRQSDEAGTDEAGTDERTMNEAGYGEAPTDEAGATDEAGTDEASTDATDLFTAEAVAEPVDMRTEKPNPLEAVYLASRDGREQDAKQGPQYRVPSGGRVFPTSDAADEATALLRRAAGKHKGGLRSVVRPAGADESTGFVVFFTWHELKPRDYTSDEVRAWAAENGHEAPATGRLPRALINAYRVAHDMPVRETPDEVREWFTAQGTELPAGKVSQEARNQYRQAHGYPVVTTAG